MPYLNIDEPVGKARTWVTAKEAKQASEIDRLKAENERLRGIVDKLPKTADGVPAVPGMELWTRHDVVHGAGPDADKKWKIKKNPTIFKSYDRIEIIFDYSDGMYTPMWLDECYSTEESARKAQAEED